jgi:two-component sensor histidine kinase
MPRPFRARYRLDPTSIARARHDVHDHFGDELPGATSEELGLIVSELVTNAIRHGGGDVELRLDVRAGRIRGEVIDQGEGFEGQMREATPDRLGGHGLVIVDRLSHEWGVYDGSSHVWFQLPVVGAPDVAVAPIVGEPDDDALPDA